MMSYFADAVGKQYQKSSSKRKNNPEIIRFWGLQLILSFLLSAFLSALCPHIWNEGKNVFLIVVVQE